MQKLFFDIETTGPDASKDRIVQLAIRIVDEKGKVLLNKSKMYNPLMPISPAATQIHGITNSMVADCPKFEEDAKRLKKIFEDKILITYNGLMFDIPILMNEFDRARVEVNLSGKFIDVFKVEQKLNPRSLANVYKSYTGEELANAHDAKADNMATAVVLENQSHIIWSDIDKNEADCTVEEMLYQMSGTEGMVDYYGKFGKDDQDYLIFKFGKHKGKNVRVIDDMEYATWMLSQNFPNQIKNLIREEQKKVQRQIFKKQTASPTPSFKNTPQEFNFGATSTKTGNKFDDIADDLPF
jgi:DNA polymerase-3 subunit epsilon